MKGITILILSLVFNIESADIAENETLAYQPADRQLLDFKLEHPEHIGLWAMSSGEPTEVRNIFTVNSDHFNNQLFLDDMLHIDGERIPERVVHAKGTGAFGYFEVTHDVSKYTYADIFNGIGKRTPLIARLSNAVQDLGGTDIGRELRGMAVKLYTREGNLDFTCISTPVYIYRDPILFSRLVLAFKRNPKTHLFDFTPRWDILTLVPTFIHTFFWIFADYGIPNGYRRMDAFPIHTYELANNKGETHYVRFNFRTEQGASFLTTEQAIAMSGLDPDYFTRDLYNSIEQKNYPAWRLEMDVMTKDDLTKIDYDPFDVTRLWKNGTFFTVQIGRMVLNKNVENQFRDVEQGAFNPAHLVPGIPGPVDSLFKGRRMFYRDTQNYRVGRNHNKILINTPLYAKNYHRDGKPPTRLNGKDGPNYYPNSFNGPVPYVDEKRPKVKLLTLENNAVDFDVLSYFYNHILEDEAHRQRFVNNIALSLVPVTPPVLQRVIKILYLIDKGLGNRVTVALAVARTATAAQNAATVPLVTTVRNYPTAQNDKDYTKSKNITNINPGKDN